MTQAKRIIVSDQLKGILSDEFNDRRKRNPSYSIRAFAKSLKADPSFITKLFSGKRGIGLKKFIQYASSAKIPSQKFRHVLKDTYDANIESIQFQSANQYKFMTEMRASILMGIVSALKPRLDYSEIARLSGYQVNEVQDIIDRAIENKVLSIDADGSLVHVEGDFMLPTEMDSEAVKCQEVFWLQCAEKMTSCIRSRIAGNLDRSKTFHSAIQFDHVSGLFSASAKNELTFQQIKMISKLLNTSKTKNGKQKPKATNVCMLSIAPTWEENQRKSI